MVSGRGCKMLTRYSDNWGEHHPRNTCLNTVFQSETETAVESSHPFFLTTNRFFNFASSKCFYFLQQIAYGCDIVLLKVQYTKNVKMLWSKLDKVISVNEFSWFCYKRKNLLTLVLNAWIDQSVINDCWNNTEHPFPFKVFSNDNTSKSYLSVIFLFSLDRWLFKFLF